MIRQPAVAGAFYPADRGQLTDMLESLFADTEPVSGTVGAVSPHAGYMYSGGAAGALFAALEVPETVVILGPNHRGLGAAYGIFDKGAWKTPLGEAAVDEDFAVAVKAEAPFAKSDTASHVYEHSIEVQVPFLQFRRPEVKIVPICIGEHDFGRLVQLGAGIAEAARKTGVEPLILASSDMTHYEPAEEAARKDRLAIDRMLALDEEGLWRVVRDRGITMCGVAPAVAAIAASRGLGADAARLVRYTNSGETTGDEREVVGYASIAFHREAE